MEPDAAELVERRAWERFVVSEYPSARDASEVFSAGYRAGVAASPRMPKTDLNEEESANLQRLMDEPHHPAMAAVNVERAKAALDRRRRRATLAASPSEELSKYVQHLDSCRGWSESFDREPFHRWTQVWIGPCSCGSGGSPYYQPNQRRP